MKVYVGTVKSVFSLMFKEKKQRVSKTRSDSLHDFFREGGEGGGPGVI